MVNLMAGEELRAGDLVYIGKDGMVYLYRPQMGIAKNAASKNEKVEILTQGTVSVPRHRRKWWQFWKRNSKGMYLP